MGNEGPSARDVANPVELNEVLWTELSVLRPAATKIEGDSARTGPAPALQALYRDIGRFGQDPEGPEPLSAVCLSGGGIRSATFNLGVLQHLARLGILKNIDYLSSVSGGGYIASWLQAWLHHEPQALAKLQSFSPPNAFEPEPQPVKNLREYSNYLTPKLGLFSPDTWTAAAMVVRNMLLNWLVIVPALAAVAAIPWLFLACVENNEVFASLDGLFVIFATFTEFIASILVFQSRRYSGSLQYGQADFVRKCVAPIVLAAALLCIAVLGLGRWISPDAQRTSSDLWHVWIFAAIWCVVNPLLGWAVVESGLLAPKQPAVPITTFSPTISSIKRRYELWGLVISGAITAVLLVAVALYWLPLLYTASAWYVVLGLPILLGLYLLARTSFVAFASASENPSAAAATGNVNDADREWWARLSGWVLLVAVGWIAVTAICLFGPIGLRWLAENVSDVVPALVAALGGASGVLAAIVGSRDGTNASDAPANASPLRKVALGIAAPLFAAVVIIMVAWGAAELGFFTAMLAERLVDAVGYDRYPSSLDELTPWAFLVLPIVLGLLAYSTGRIVNVNRFSLHGFYRNRLVRAYLGASRADRNGDPFTGFSLDDNFPLADLQERMNPSAKTPGTAPAKTQSKLLPIVNTTLNLVRSGEKLAWQQRKSESFSMTPYFCGNHRQGYRSSRHYGGKSGISLGTAMAISGAAANPNMGYNSSPAVGFLMALFNARLGAWFGNTNRNGEATYGRTGPRQALWPLFAELFGLTNASGSYVNLSDGGHFDNLGLYEVVLRRCRHILVSDASCDGKGTFEDLGNAIRKIRIDFGISIDFTRQIEIHSNSDDKPGLYCALANIRYSDADGEDAKDGKLVYIKATRRACGTPLPYDVYSYARASDAFPHESTSDQWFSESQFESYRALGRHALTQILGNQPLAAFDELVTRAERYIGAPIVLAAADNRPLAASEAAAPARPIAATNVNADDGARIERYTI